MIKNCFTQVHCSARDTFIIEQETLEPRLECTKEPMDIKSLLLEIVEEEAKFIANNEQQNQENVLNVLKLFC